MGKTVLLSRFAGICTGEGFLPILRLQYGRQHSDPTELFKTARHDLDTAVREFPRTEGVGGD